MKRGEYYSLEHPEWSHKHTNEKIWEAYGTVFKTAQANYQTQHPSLIQAQIMGPVVFATILFFIDNKW